MSVPRATRMPEATPSHARTTHPLRERLAAPGRGSALSVLPLNDALRILQAPLRVAQLNAHLVELQWRAQGQGAGQGARWGVEQCADTHSRDIGHSRGLSMGVTES
jgi:hypothetical protein